MVEHFRLQLLRCVYWQGGCVGRRRRVVENAFAVVGRVVMMVAHAALWSYVYSCCVVCIGGLIVMVGGIYKMAVLWTYVCLVALCVLAGLL